MHKIPKMCYQGSDIQPCHSVCLPGAPKYPKPAPIDGAWRGLGQSFQLRARSIPPAPCGESACSCYPRTPTRYLDSRSARLSVPAVIQPVTLAQRWVDIKATLKVPRRTAFVFDACSLFPLRKWKEGEITLNSLGSFMLLSGQPTSFGRNRRNPNLWMQWKPEEFWCMQSGNSLTRKGKLSVETFPYTIQAQIQFLCLPCLFCRRQLFFPCLYFASVKWGWQYHPCPI